MMSISGRWRGWYARARGGPRLPLEMTLESRGARISGSGKDDAGDFSVAGAFAPDTGRASWLLRHASRSADFAGKCDGTFLRGGWRQGETRGLFCLWRDGPGGRSGRPERPA